MKKKRTGLDILLLDAEPAPTKEPVIDASSDKPRIIKQTLYLPEIVHEQLRVLAFSERAKQRDLLMGGLDLVFKSRGQKSIEELIEADK